MLRYLIEWWAFRKAKYRLFRYKGKTRVWSISELYTEMVLTWWDLSCPDDFEKSDYDIVKLEKRDWLGYWDTYRRWDRHAQEVLRAPFQEIRDKL